MKDDILEKLSNSKFRNSFKLKENEIKYIEVEMYKEENSTDYEKLKKMQDEIQNINIEIENKMEEWEELNSKINN